MFASSLSPENNERWVQNARRLCPLLVGHPRGRRRRGVPAVSKEGPPAVTQNGSVVDSGRRLQGQLCSRLLAFRSHFRLSAREGGAASTLPRCRGGEPRAGR